MQRALRILEQLARLLTLVGVIENLGITAVHLPGMEERRPIDIVRDLLQGKMLENLYPEELRHRRRVSGPVDLSLIGAGLLQGQPFGMGTAPGMLFAHLRVLAADLGHEIPP